MCPPCATNRHWRGPGWADSYRSPAPRTAAWSRGRSAGQPRRDLRIRTGRERLADLGEQLVTHHVVALIDRVGEALGVGSAMAFDDDPVKPEKDAAIRLARIHFAGKRPERAPREQVAELRDQAAAQLLFEIMGELARGALGRFECDVAGKTFRYHHVDGSLADIIALDEAGITEVRPASFTENFPGIAHRLQSLCFLYANVKEPDRWPLDAEQRGGHGAAHGSKADEMRGIGADRGAEIEHDGLPLQRRPDRGDRRSFDAGHGLELELGHRHERAGIAG